MWLKVPCGVVVGTTWYGRSDKVVVEGTTWCGIRDHVYVCVSRGIRNL